MALLSSWGKHVIYRRTHATYKMFLQRFQFDNNNDKNFDNNKAIWNIFQAFLKGETQILADEAFQNAVQSYHDVFLKSERVEQMVKSGACSHHDFREVFRNNIEKRVRFADKWTIFPYYLFRSLAHLYHPCLSLYIDVK